MSSRFLSLSIFALVVLIAGVGLTRLSLNTDILGILPAEVPSVEAMKSFQKHFAEERSVIVVMQSGERGVSEEEAGSLADLFRARHPSFEVTYRSTFEDNPDELATSVARLWSYAPPEERDRLLARLRDPDALAARLNGIRDDLATGFDSQGLIGSYDPIGFLQHPALVELFDSQMSFESDSGEHRIVMIRKTENDSASYQDDAIWLAEIRESIDEWKREFPLISYSLTGGPVFNAEIGGGMEGDMSGTITATSILVGLLFLLFQRNIIQLLIIIGLLTCTFFVTLGLGGWIFGTLNLVSVGFAAILLGLVIDYAVVIARESIHFPNSLAELRRAVTPGITWAAVSTAAVFGVLMFSTFTGVRELAALVAIGLIAGAGIALLFAPTLFARFSAKPARMMTKPLFLSTRSAFVVSLLLLLGIVVICGWKGLPKVTLNLSMVEPTSSEAAATFETIQNEFSAWSEDNTILITKADSEAELVKQGKLAGKELEGLLDGGKIDSFQWSPLLIPNRDRFTQNRAVFGEGFTQETRNRVEKDILEAGFTDQALALDRKILDAFAELPATSNDLIKLCASDPLIGRFFDFDQDGSLFFSGKVTASDKTTLSIFGGESTSQVYATGWPEMQNALTPLITRDFYVLFIPSAAALLIAILLVFRNWREAMIPIIVLILSLLLINALLVMLGQDWNFLNGMAIPLIVGAGIDYSIHLIFALRRTNGDWAQVWNGVGKAICFCGLSTAIGFGSLLLASNAALRSMGLACCLGVLTTMALSLLIIPGLWTWQNRAKVTSSPAAESTS